MRFNEVTGDPRALMTTNRMWDSSAGRSGGVRPTVRTLRILACIYGTTWDLLVDAADLAQCRTLTGQPTPRQPTAGRA